MAAARKKRTAPAKQRGDRQQPTIVDATWHQMTEDSIASLKKVQARLKGRKSSLTEITEIIEDARTLEESLLRSLEEANDGKPEGKTEPKNPKISPLLGEITEFIEDARKLQESLLQSIEKGYSGSPEDEVEPENPKIRPLVGIMQGLNLRKILKSALGLLILVYIGWQPLQRLFQVSSVEAVVNAHLITLRSPIEGTVTSQLAGLGVGADVASSAHLFTIDNSRAEHPRFDDLRRQIPAISDERLLDATKLHETTRLLEEMKSRVEMFRSARIRQLQSRINAGHSEISAATAKHAVAKEHLKRQKRLFSGGTVALSKFQEAERDARVAELSIKALERRLDVMNVELEALKSGIFVGDSYNDIPYSSQRSYDLRQQITDLKAKILRNDRRIARLQKELADEERRAKRLVQANVIAPRKARIWEVLTAPGEQVNRGQELVRLLDCSLPVVTAAVTETVYNTLSIGALATFRYRQTGEELPGKVVQLTGVASAPANLAITPNALKREAFRVMVNVPGLAGRANCNIGQTGRVVFNSGSSATTSARES